MPHRTRPMAALLMFTGLNMVLICFHPLRRVRNMIKWICDIPLYDGTYLTDLPDDLPIEENNSKTCLTNLPDEIVIKILSKLPRRILLKPTSKVQPSLRSPTTTSWICFSSTMKLIDTNWSRSCATVSLEWFPMCLQCWLDLMMFLGSQFLVWDLVTREYAYLDAPANVVPVPSPFHFLSLTAILLHSVTQGFKLLFSSQRRDPETGYRYEFFVYESRNNMWRKLTTSTYPPTSYINQVVVNPTIYKNCVFWMAPCNVKGLVNNPPCRSSVVIFNMNAEEFHSRPHPGDECGWSGLLHNHMYFFEVKGQLYFCHNSLKTIGIWSLEGYDRWYWVKIQDIKLDYLLKAISVCIEVDEGVGNKLMNGILKGISFEGYTESFPSQRYGFDNVRLMKIEGDQIFFHCWYRGLFMYDFRKNMMKKVDRGRKGHCVFLNSTNQFAYSDSSVSLKSGFRCRQKHGKIHASVII